VLSPRAHHVLRHPAVGALIVYVFGVLLRIEYSLHLHPPESFISSDMANYVNLARRLAFSSEPLMPLDATHPLGYPALLAFLISGGGSLARAANFQIVVSALVPLAVGWLGWVTFGFRTALAAVAFASVYFPFIEYGAYFLSEIHFILWLTVSFAALFAARDAHRPLTRLLLSAAGGFALSLAASFKAVAVFGVIVFFAVDAIGLVLASSIETGAWRARLRNWVWRGVVAALASMPIFSILARVCTRANRGNFCVLGKMGADFLLGHYGRVADIDWAADEGSGFHQFGSPGSYLRHYELHERVPFSIMDNAANRAEAWHWIFAHPFDAIVLSLDHVYDTFFGVAMWPSYGLPSWPMAQLAQYVFVVLLLAPTVFACARVLKRGVRAFLASRTMLVLSPVLGLTFTVAMATGEVRYRIPFDVFFIVVACALVVGDLRRVDGAPAA
jgi:4-amino-4-deoxy-L-arabinose transferase-like glycosyltransferase